MNNIENNAVATPQDNNKGMTIYRVNDNEVKLSVSLVRRLILENNQSVTNDSIINAILVCRNMKLDPYLHEVYLIPRGNKLSLVVSKEALLKRAQQDSKFNGIQSGVICIDKEGNNLREYHGGVCLPGQTIVGAWAKVWMKNFEQEIYVTVDLNEYHQHNSLWNSKTKTMIIKVAEVQALRMAFPKLLAGIYTAEEQYLEEQQIQTLNNTIQQPTIERPQQEQLVSETKTETETIGFEEEDSKEQDIA